MKNIKIHFLNTIWSDAILLENNNHYGFVDTGSLFYYPMVDKHLKDLNIKNIEFIILTHFHSDHYGNIVNIVNDYNVKKLYLKHYYGLDGTTSSGFESNEEYIKNEFIKYDNVIDACKANNTEIVFVDEYDNNDIYTIKFNDIDIELYDIKNTLYELYSDINGLYYNQKRFNENFNSMGVFIKIGNNNIYKKHNIDQIDIYKSCHHGGGGTNTKELCNLMKSKYCIITNTARWLDTYSTFDNLKNGNKDVVILPSDHQKYIFSIDENNIKYEEIKEESLFITLGKN